MEMNNQNTYLSECIGIQDVWLIIIISHYLLFVCLFWMDYLYLFVITSSELFHCKRWCFAEVSQEESAVDN